MNNDLEHILAHTTPVREELRGKRVFLTGGTGFFGCWFLESFSYARQKLGLDTTLTVLTRDPDAFRKKQPRLANHAGVDFHPGDVRTFAYPTGAYSHIIHAATPASVTFNDQQPLDMFAVVVEGTRRVLEFARVSGCEKFLLTSSGAIYGTQPPTLMNIGEDHHFGPDLTSHKSAYAEGKRAAEMLCTLYAKAYGLNCKVARCFAFIGPYLPINEHFAAGNFIRDALERKPIQIQGDGTPYRSYLYGSDLMIWLWTILANGQSCRPYNVGSPAPVSIRELAFAAASLVTPAIDVQIAKTPVHGVLPARYVPDVSRAHVELGLTARIGLHEALRKTLDWHLSK